MSIIVDVSSAIDLHQGCECHPSSLGYFMCVLHSVTSSVLQFRDWPSSAYNMKLLLKMD